MLVGKLSQEDAEYVQGSLIGEFLDHSCYEFAAALYSFLGWPIWALRTRDYPIRHAVVQDHAGDFWDARGKVTVHELELDFGSFNLQPIKPKELWAVRPPRSLLLIRRAAKQAQTLWPDLPWKSRALISRAEDFIKDLEILCNRHGIGLRGMVPASRVFLDLKFSADTDYVLIPTVDGMGYTLQRRIRGLIY